MSEHAILVVSASTGTGHVRAGEAIRQALLAHEPGLTVEHIDLLTHSPRWVQAAYGNGYEMLATRTPRLWREIYTRTDLPSPDLARWGPAIHRTLFREFRRLLMARRWSACVCTHFLPGQLAAGTPGAPPFSMVITDLTLHHFWAQPRVRRFFVGNQELAIALRPRVPGSAVDVTGIPVAPSFVSPADRNVARRALSLAERRPTVLVMGGGLGLGIEASAVAALGARIPNLQVLVVCGRNELAFRSLSLLDPAGERLRVLGYVKDIENYIAAADLVVTKPGGLTTSEVLAVGRPMLLTRPIPGQEEGNSRILLAAGAAEDASDPDRVRANVERIFGDPQLLERLTFGARALARPGAAAAIAGEVLLESSTRAVA